MSRSISTMDKTIYMLEAKVQHLESVLSQLEEPKLNIEDSMQAEIERQFHYFCTERNELKAKIERLDELTGYQTGQLLGLEQDRSGLVDINEKLKAELERANDQLSELEKADEDNLKLGNTLKIAVAGLHDREARVRILEQELERASTAISILKEANSEFIVENKTLTLTTERYRTMLAELLTWSEEYVNYDSNGKCIGSIERARAALKEGEEK